MKQGIHTGCHSTSHCHTPRYTPSRPLLTNPQAIQKLTDSLKTTYIYRYAEDFCRVCVSTLIFNATPTMMQFHNVRTCTKILTNSIEHVYRPSMYTVWLQITLSFCSAVTPTGLSLSITCCWHTYLSAYTFLLVLSIWGWTWLSWIGYVAIITLCVYVCVHACVCMCVYMFVYLSY